MALYDGFFDAVLDESTLQYDRAYNSGDFTEYFGEIVGSGVCIHSNENSMLVRGGNAAALISPGYLFIRGYWLKNTADYEVPISEDGICAVLAHLNTGARRIEINTQPRADPEVYPDSLVLAYLTVDAGAVTFVEDTRYNTDICGVINSAGALSSKVEWAINYINNEIDKKLAQAEADIQAQARLLDEKIEEVSLMVEKLEPPPIGTVKFSASTEIEDGWLPCDGRFVSESEYPDLVAALGKKYPSGDKFFRLSYGEIGQQISNAALYGGKLWVYSYSERRLYGVDTGDGENTVSISVESSNPDFLKFVTPTPDNPLVLSIVPHKSGNGARLFLSQIIADGPVSAAHASSFTGFEAYFLLFSSEFTGTEIDLTMTAPIVSIKREILSSNQYTYPRFLPKKHVPYVISRMEAGVETYYCACCLIQNKYGYNDGIYGGDALVWTDASTEAAMVSSGLYLYGNGTYHQYQRFGFSPKNQGEAVSVRPGTGSSSSYMIFSAVQGLFSLPSTTNSQGTPSAAREVELPLNIVGDTAVITELELSSFCAWKRHEGGAFAVSHGIPLPSAARLFYDAGGYLWGKSIYVIFVGTGILFFRELSPGSVGYLDTTDVLGQITQYGFLEYSRDENELYLIGQDTTNKVVVAKMVLNTLFDYANDGAWLPLIASDGVPAYIKAEEV